MDFTDPKLEIRGAIRKKIHKWLLMELKLPILTGMSLSSFLDYYLNSKT